MISESATILIVEDEQDIRELLAYNLEKEGYATVQAADGKEGLELARSRKPDLILLDLMLPKMDGLAVPLSIWSARFVHSSNAVLARCV